MIILPKTVIVKKKSEMEREKFLIPFNDFGKEFRIGLVELNMSQADFLRLLNKRYGKYIDSGYMFKLKTGRQKVPKMERRIRELMTDLRSGYTGEYTN